MKPGVRSRWLWRLVAVFIVALLVVPLLRWQATLSFLGRYLIDSQPPQPADLILVLAGDFYGPRVIRAAELVKQGYAPLVLISGTPYQDGMEGEYAIAFLAQQGYPMRLFKSFGHDAHSTIEEAMVLRGELARRHVKKVILVTSAFHSRRSLIVFWLFCPGIHFISIPGADTNFDANAWWKHDGSRALFYSEWEKIMGTIFMAYPKECVRRLFGK